MAPKSLAPMAAMAPSWKWPRLWQDGHIPMAILPGGTANLMSVELGIPKDLTQAAQIIVDPGSVVRYVDMGQVGNQRFMLRVGIGFAGEKVKIADRELKDKWGILAYSIAGLKALKTTPVAQLSHHCGWR